MPHYFELESADTISKLPDEFKDLFKPFTPPDVDGLKSKNQELLSEKKKVDTELAEVKAENKRLKLDPPKGDESELQQKLNDATHELEDAKKKLEDKDNEIGELNGKITKSTITSKAKELASQNTKDPQRQAMLASQIESRLKLEGDTIKVLDKSGETTVSTLDQLVAEVKTDAPFLFDGSGASGGGAGGAGSGGANDSKTVTRSDWDSMSETEKNKFVDDGGTVTDD